MKWNNAFSLLTHTAGIQYTVNDFRVAQVRHQLALETLSRLVRSILTCSHEILPGYILFTIHFHRAELC